MLCEDVTFRSGPEGLEIAIQQAGKDVPRKDTHKCKGPGAGKSLVC